MGPPLEILLSSYSIHSWSNLLIIPNLSAIAYTIEMKSSIWMHLRSRISSARNGAERMRVMNFMVDFW